MRKAATVDFFLGALSPAGFTGWFAQAAAEDGQTAWLIKAGPGCGKSTLMRRLLDAAGDPPAGQYNERLHCSSDPASLDGVRLPGAAALFLDATAPHTLDCKYPGAAERVVSLYDALDNDALARQSGQILALGRRNADLMARAAAHWALACGLLARRRAEAADLLDRDRLQRYAARLAARTMPPRRGAAPGARAHRLLSAPTPGQITLFADTVPALADRTIYVIRDPDGAAAPRLLALLADHARRNGYDAVLCHCPTDQAGKLDHLLLPRLGLGFVTANPWHPLSFPGQRTVQASRFRRAGTRPPRRSNRLAGALIRRTCETQARAKAVHDALEAPYVRATDFAAVDAVRRRCEQALFG